MFGRSELKKCKKQLQELKDTRDLVERKLEKLETKYSSNNWVGYNTGTVRRFADRYANCPSCKEKEDIISACEDLEAAYEAVDAFVENVYAAEVFRAYSKKKPKLVRVSTEEVYTWEEAFGESFDSLEKGLRHSLVGLVEEPTRYRLK